MKTGTERRTRRGDTVCCVPYDHPFAVFVIIAFLLLLSVAILHMSLPISPLGRGFCTKTMALHKRTYSMHFTCIRNTLCACTYIFFYIECAKLSHPALHYIALSISSLLSLSLSLPTSHFPRSLSLLLSPIFHYLPLSLHLFLCPPHISSSLSYFQR